MAGFNPVGSTPVASILVASNLPPSPTSIIFSGFSAGFTPAVKLRLAQFEREVLHAGTGKIRLAQFAREVLMAGGGLSGVLNMAQFVREVMHPGTGKIHLAQFVREVLVSQAVSGRRGKLLMAGF